MANPVTPEARARIKQMLAYGAKRQAIAKATGYSATTVTNVMRGRHEKAPIKRRTVREILGPPKRGGLDPTPAEIAKACDAIRRVREQEDLAIAASAVDCVVGWTPPMVSVPLVNSRL